MSLVSFVAALFEHGRVQVPPPDAKEIADDADEVCRLLDDRARALALAFPGDAPPLEMDVALWAARQLYRASQLAVYRELDAAAIEELLRPACPSAPPTTRHWSVDLLFVFLPNLILLARTASEYDPLVVRLHEWAAEWPLSSVGVAGVSPKNVHEIVEHAGLLQLYVDRILAKKDWSRLKDDRVRSAARQSLGAHLSEWPEAAKVLESWEPPATSTTA
jgi:hypothetical protein